MNEFLAELKPWVPFISLLTVIAAAIAAGAAWFSARGTKKAIRAPIVLEILSEYASKDMLEHLRILLKWKVEYDKNKIIAKIRLKNSSSDEVDISRRAVSHFYFKLYKLVNTDVVNKRFMKKLISHEQSGIYIDIVQILDEQLNKDYDRTPFGFFRDLHIPRWKHYLTAIKLKVEKRKKRIIKH